MDYNEINVKDIMENHDFIIREVGGIKNQYQKTSLTTQKHMAFFGLLVGKTLS